MSASCSSCLTRSRRLSRSTPANNTPVETRAFSGSGAVRVEIDSGSRETRTLIEPLTHITGLDGCRPGWIAMVKDGSSIVPWRHLR
jgi:hypothetical protein